MSDDIALVRAIHRKWLSGGDVLQGVGVKYGWILSSQTSVTYPATEADARGRLETADPQYDWVLWHRRTDGRQQLSAVKVRGQTFWFDHELIDEMI